MTLKEIIVQNKKKKRDENIPKDICDFVMENIDLFVKEISKKLQELGEELNQKLLGQINERLSTIKPAEKGDPGKSIVGPPGPKGDSIIGSPGPPGLPGKSPDENKIIKAVIKKIPPPKDIDENKIIKEVLNKIEIPKPKDIEISAKDIVKKLEGGKEKLSISLIKGLAEELRNIMRAVREKSAIMRGGGDIVQYSDLSSQCNGSLKAFSIPVNRKILGVFGTQFPTIYRPVIDWTSGGTTLTLTAEVSAPASGQTLFILYVR